MRVLVQLLLVAAVLAGGWKASTILADRGEVGGRPTEAIVAPLVETQTPTRAPFIPVLQGTGETRPSRRAWIVPEVAGVVRWVAPGLVQGALVQAGAPLLRLDPTDLELERERAQAEVDRARARASQEAALAEQAAREQALLGVEEPGDLALRKPQQAEALAAVRAAEAALAVVNQNLGRLELRAPFDATVQSVEVGLGQLVQRGNRLGELASTDALEVVVPLRDRDLAHLPFAVGQGLAPSETVPCELAADFAGQRVSFEARLARIDGSLDPKSRLVRVVLEVQDPYGLATPRPVPLFSGSHVEASIQGRAIENALLLPRSALGPGDVVWIAEDEGRLARREVTVSWRTRDSVVVTAGLGEGERVVVSPLANPVEGMAVRLLPRDVEVR